MFVFCGKSCFAVKAFAIVFAVLDTERLYEVYRERKLLGFNEITNADVNQFFRSKGAQEPLIEGWIDSTKTRLRGIYYTFMTDAGLLTTENRKHMITPPLLDIALERYLEAKGETAVIKAITGVN